MSVRHELTHSPPSQRGAHSFSYWMNHDNDDNDDNVNDDNANRGQAEQVVELERSR